MKDVPKEITVCYLEVVVMPQGEVICKGKTVGWFKELKEYLIKKEGKGVDMGRLLGCAERLLSQCTKGGIPKTYLGRFSGIAPVEGTILKEKGEVKKC